MIYLDWAATAIPDEDIQKEALKESFEFFGNPSAVHKAGKVSKERLEKARSEIAKMLRVSSAQIIFTSGGTESDYLPMLELFTKIPRRGIAVSAVEHSAITEQVKSMASQGFEVSIIPVNRKGFVEPETIIKTIKKNTGFVSVMAVNNETGAIQPVKEIASALKEFSGNSSEIHFHVDAVQALGKIPFDLNDTGISSASFSGHKIGAARGCGFLYSSKPLNSFLRGGGQEKGMRSGTENLFGILTIEKCLAKTFFSFNEDFEKAYELSDFLINNLKAIENIEIFPNCRCAGDKSFSPWIVQFSNKKLTGEILVRCLSEKNIFISSGSACSSKKPLSKIAAAMGLPSALQKNIARVSIGRNTTKEDLTYFIRELKKIISEF